MNPEDILRLGFEDGDSVDLTTAIDANNVRKVTALRIVAVRYSQGLLRRVLSRDEPALSAGSP
jgi:anaerobic selenocysteine-containing dehydrogenase